MDEEKFKEKLVEFLMELSKPKKFEVGFIQGNRIINDGLVMLGMNATDILGFAKPENERRIRKVRGTQAWFKKMYDDGWKYAGTFEQEGLLNNGFVVMEKELPNKVLDAIREELEVMLRNDDSHYKLRIPDPILKAIKESNPDALRPLPESLKENKDMGGYGLHKNKGDLEKAVKKAREKITKESLKAMGYKEDEISVIRTVKEPREGFESDVNDFMIGAQKEMKTDEQLFFEETGKNAVWKGKETIAFKKWKKEIEL